MMVMIKIMTMITMIKIMMMMKMTENLILMHFRMGAPAKDTSFQVIVVIIVFIFSVITTIIFIGVVIVIINLLTAYLLKTDDREVGDSEQHNLPSIVSRGKPEDLLHCLHHSQFKKSNKHTISKFPKCKKDKMQKDKKTNSQLPRQKTSMHSICYLASICFVVSNQVTNNISFQIVLGSNTS